MTSVSFATRYRIRELASIAAILAILGATPHVARAQSLTDADVWAPTDTADRDTQQAVTELMRTGIREYRKHNLEPARKAFEDAWRLKRHPAIAVSLAEVEMKLGLYHEALEHWRYYVERSSVEHASDRADAETQMRECRKHLGSVRVTISPRDAKLFVDDETTGTGSPEGPLLLAPGEHALRAEIGGRSSPTVRITVAADQDQDQGVALVVPPDPLAPRLVVPAAAPRVPGPRPVPGGGTGSGHAPTAVLVTGGLVAGAAIGIGVAYTLAAASTRNRADQLLRQVESTGDPKLAKRSASCTPPEGIRPPQCNELAEKVNEADSRTKLSVLAYATGGVFAAATAATYFLWPHTASNLSSSAFTIAPWSAPGVHGVRLDLNF